MHAVIILCANEFQVICRQPITIIVVIFQSMYTDAKIYNIQLIIMTLNLSVKVTNN